MSAVSKGGLWKLRRSSRMGGHQAGEVYGCTGDHPEGRGHGAKSFERLRKVRAGSDPQSGRLLVTCHKLLPWVGEDRSPAAAGGKETG